MRTTLALSLTIVASFAHARPAVAQGRDLTTPPGLSFESHATSPTSPQGFLQPDLSFASGGCSANMLVNGDFELNGAAGCDFNLTNDLFDQEMLALHAFGGASEIDVMKAPDGCGYGPPPLSGITKLGLHARGDGSTDALSFQLTATLVPAIRYRLHFYIAAETTFDPDPGTIEIGASNDPGDFGILLTPVTPTVGVWSGWQLDFILASEYRYLTVREGPGSKAWGHIDNWVLMPVCDAPAGFGTYGNGWPGTNGIPQLLTSDYPRLCTPISIFVGNSRGANTQAALMLGFTQVDLPTALGGRLLVAPSSVVVIQIPPGGASLPVCAPCDGALCGLLVFLQAIENDPGASQGASFTPGLLLALGS